MSPANFWRRSVIYSFHAVKLHSPITFFFIHISVTFFLPDFLQDPENHARSLLAHSVSVHPCCEHLNPFKQQEGRELAFRLMPDMMEKDEIAAFPFLAAYQPYFYLAVRNLALALWSQNAKVRSNILLLLLSRGHDGKRRDRSVPIPRPLPALFLSGRAQFGFGAVVPEC
jgi:hypothetical protein